MILDSLLEFGDATSVVSNAGATYNLGTTSNILVDSSAVSRDLGAGEPVYFVVTVDTALTAAAAGSITIKLVSDSTTTIATDGSATTHISQTFTTDTTASAANKTTAGSIMLCAALPRGVTYERYLAVQYTVTTQNMATGKINAFLTKDPNGWAAYADATN